MQIEYFELADKHRERNFFDAGGNIIDIFNILPHNMPFNVYPALGFERIDFDGITLFAGSGASVRDLTVKVIAAKLGAEVTLNMISRRTLGEYLPLCLCRATDYKHVYFSNETESAYYEEKRTRLYRNEKFSILDLYKKNICDGAFVIIENPESYMSLYETYDFVEYIQALSEKQTNQFLITTNSPIILRTDKALIYDFDTVPIVAHRMCDSPLAAYCNNTV